MRLLILSSSKRQRKEKKFLPALERYDGLMFRIIKKLKREGDFPSDLDIVIVSSKFGLLSPFNEIPYSDNAMTYALARKLRTKFLEELQEILQKKKYSEIFVNLGAIYAESIMGLSKHTKTRLIYAHGRLGERARQVKMWIVTNTKRGTS